MKTAVLLLAHGTPETVEQVPEYLNYVTGGRPLPAAVIEEIQHRYQRIGPSPLTKLTFEQAAALERVLSSPPNSSHRTLHGPVRVYVGMRNWRPFIADTVNGMTSDGVTHAAAICLAPQYSRTSVGLYRRAVEKASQGKIDFEFVESWHDHPELISAFAGSLRAALELARHESGAHPPIVFTAHSVPCKTIMEGGKEDAGEVVAANSHRGDARAAAISKAHSESPHPVADPYARQAKETAKMVAKSLRLKDSEWSFAFQSQGASGGPWIGPTVESTIAALAAAGHRSVLVHPVGFLCDHVEVLYDVDIAFRDFARQHGMTLWRAESLNVDPQLISALEQLSREHLARLVARETALSTR